jgi:hypothetical protein
MLIPKEKPYLSGLNSYYLYIDKFIEHLQGDIGSGCLYCRSIDQEILVYFDERDIVRGVIQQSGEHVQISESIEPVLQSLDIKNFEVNVYYLDSSSIFFWGQIPEFKRAKATLNSSDIPLEDLVYRLKQKRFSGFLDISLLKRNEGAILFFHQGERRGGSYSWGKGGLNPSDDEYNRLLGLLQSNAATYEIGHFKSKSKKAVGTPDEQSADSDSPMYFSNLNTAMEEFMAIFIQVTRKKVKTDPLILLKQKFLDVMDQYPVLEPFNNFYDLKDDGSIEFAENAPREDIASAIVDAAWKVVEDNKLQKKFNATIKKWAYRSALEERGIEVDR